MNSFESFVADSGPSITLEDAIHIEPRIGGILNEARRDTRKNNTSAFHEYKHRLHELVGWQAKKEALTTRAAYDVVFGALSEALNYKP